MVSLPILALCHVLVTYNDVSDCVSQIDNGYQWMMDVNGSQMMNDDGMIKLVLAKAL